MDIATQHHRPQILANKGEYYSMSREILSS